MFGLLNFIKCKFSPTRVLALEELDKIVNKKMSHSTTTINSRKIA